MESKRPRNDKMKWLKFSFFRPMPKHGDKETATKTPPKTASESFASKVDDILFDKQPLTLGELFGMDDDDQYDDDFYDMESSDDEVKVKKVRKTMEREVVFHPPKQDKTLLENQPKRKERPLNRFDSWTAKQSRRKSTAVRRRDSKPTFFPSDRYAEDTQPMKQQYISSRAKKGKRESVDYSLNGDTGGNSLSRDSPIQMKYHIVKKTNPPTVLNVEKRFWQGSSFVLGPALASVRTNRAAYSLAARKLERGSQEARGIDHFSATAERKEKSVNQETQPTGFKPDKRLLTHNADIGSKPKPAPKTISKPAKEIETHSQRTKTVYKGKKVPDVTGKIYRAVWKTGPPPPFPNFARDRKSISAEQKRIVEEGSKHLKGVAKKRTAVLPVTVKTDVTRTKYRADVSDVAQRSEEALKPVENCYTTGNDIKAHDSEPVGNPNANEVPQARIEASQRTITTERVEDKTGTISDAGVGTMATNNQPSQTTVDVKNEVVSSTNSNVGPIRRGIENKGEHHLRSTDTQSQEKPQKPIKNNEISPNVKASAIKEDSGEVQEPTLSTGNLSTEKSAGESDKNQDPFDSIAGQTIERESSATTKKITVIEEVAEETKLTPKLVKVGSKEKLVRYLSSTSQVHQLTPKMPKPEDKHSNGDGKKLRDPEKTKALIDGYSQLVRENNFADAGKARECLALLFQHKMNVDTADLEKFAYRLLQDGRYFDAVVFLQICAGLLENVASPKQHVTWIQRCSWNIQKTSEMMMRKDPDKKDLMKRHVIPILGDLLCSVRKARALTEKDRLEGAAWCLHHIEYSQHLVGDSEGREQTLKEILQLLEKAYGGEASKQLVYGYTLNNLGCTYYATGRYSEAVDAFTKALEAKRRAIGNERTSKHRREIEKSAAQLTELKDSIKCLALFENKERTVVTISEEASSIKQSGCTLTVPPKASDGEVEISITTIFEENEKSTRITPVLRCEPHGQTFKQPLLITLPTSFIRSFRSQNVQVTIESSEDGISWEEVSELRLDNSNKLSFKTEHFSFFRGFVNDIQTKIGLIKKKLLRCYAVADTGLLQCSIVDIGYVGEKNEDETLVHESSFAIRYHERNVVLLMKSKYYSVGPKMRQSVKDVWNRHVAPCSFLCHKKAGAVATKGSTADEFSVQILKDKGRQDEAKKYLLDDTFYLLTGRRKNNTQTSHHIGNANAAPIGTQGDVIYNFYNNNNNNNNQMVPAHAN